MEWCTGLWNRAPVYKRIMMNEGWIYTSFVGLVISNQGFMDMFHDSLRRYDYWKMSKFVSQVVEMGYKVIMTQFFNRHTLVCYFTRLRVLMMLI
jgi:hypothetical protein